MKKYLVVVVMLLIAGITCLANKNVKRKPGQPVKVKIQKHCDFGFGVCIVVSLKMTEPDETMADAEASYSDTKFNLVFMKEKLSDELLRQFEDNAMLPVSEDIQLPDDLIASLGLPSNATLATGNYTIEREADSFRVAIAIAK
jgi:hypothetical protein